MCHDPRGGKKSEHYLHLYGFTLNELVTLVRSPLLNMKALTLKSMTISDSKAG
jgi:hypothetical protein